MWSPWYADSADSSALRPDAPVCCRIDTQVLAVRDFVPNPEGSLMNTTQTTITARAAPDLAARLPELREALVQQRQFRLEQLDELAEGAMKPPSTGNDTPDEVNAILAAGAATALAEIEDALDRIRAGTYGTCELCIAHIPYERLEILPMSRYCIGCQRGQSTTH
jgi:DnaK suppressor protein